MMLFKTGTTYEHATAKYLPIPRLLAKCALGFKLFNNNLIFCSLQQPLIQGEVKRWAIMTRVR